MYFLSIILLFFYHLRLFASFDTLREDLVGVPDTLAEMLSMWLTRVESESMSFLVSLVCGIILCSQGYGVHENELYSVTKFYCDNRFGFISS